MLRSRFLKKTYLTHIFADLFKRFSPWRLAANPILLFVFGSAILASIILFREIIYQTDNILLYSQMTFWIWMILFFSGLADSIAYNKRPHLNKQILHTDSYQDVTLVKLLKSRNDIGDYIEVEQEKIKSGDLILLDSGDEVPFDGEIVKGSGYINETDVTGELGRVLKSAKKKDILIAGSIVESDEKIVMKVSFSSRKSFFAKVAKIMEGISRQSLPSEVALQRIITGVSVLFCSVIFAVVGIAKYSGVNIPIMYIIDLIVILLPTTISGLQKAIITFARSRLEAQEIIVNDDVALDNAVEMSVVLFDKTGTLTIGQREIIEFEPVADITQQEYMRYLFLSSVYDYTHEGESIKRYSTRYLEGEEIKIDENQFRYFHFSSSNPISGCDYKGMTIRKGSVKAIARYLKSSIQSLPKKVLQITEKIAATRGTPMLLVAEDRIIGVMHFRDRLRRGIIKQLEKFHDEDIPTIMITGDNALTASYVANKLKMRAFHAEATPEEKLKFIRKLQQQGYVVAMCGDGANDSLALAQSDIGLTFEENEEYNINHIMAGNVVAKKHDISSLLKLRSACRKMTVKRGFLTIFSLLSDIAKYFVIVPALFTTAFPPLSILNFMHFQSLESVILSSVMFNALAILVLTPVVFQEYGWVQSKKSLWRNVILFGLGGIISPFIFIKIFDIIISYLGLLG